MKTAQQYSILFFITLLFSCSSANQEKETAESATSTKETIEKKETLAPIKVDLADILKAGKLKVSTTYSGTSYFLYRGRPMGFEYELLERFTEYLGVELEIVVANDIDNLIPNLNSGKVDLMAHGLTITADRQEEIAFSDYIYLTHQVLVQKKT